MAPIWGRGRPWRMLALMAICPDLVMQLTRADIDEMISQLQTAAKHIRLAEGLIKKPESREAGSE